MKKRILALIMVVPMVFLLLAGCGNNNNQSTSNTNSNSSNNTGSTQAASSPKAVDGNLKPLKKPVTVTIAEDGSASGAGFYIAKAKGYFKQYNINVKFATFQNSSDMLPALAAGKIDIAGGISSASFFNSIAQGINVKMIADKGHNIPGKSYFSFVISNKMKGKIKSYKDFKGKKIAVSTKNGVDDYIFHRMLQHAGLKESDVNFILMPDFGNMLSATANNQVDAALQIEPLITKGVQQGMQTRFGDTTDYAPKAQIAMVLASPQFVSNHNVALRFMVAYLKGVRDYNNAFVHGTKNQDAIIKILTQYTSLKDPSVWKKVDVAGLNPNGKMYVKDIKRQYNYYKSKGAITGKVDFNKAIDTSIAADAVKILGKYNSGN